MVALRRRQRTYGEYFDIPQPDERIFHFSPGD